MPALNLGARRQADPDIPATGLKKFGGRLRAFECAKKKGVRALLYTKGSDPGEHKLNTQRE